MNSVSRTQVAIVGAGPAGLMLAHLLHRAGVDSTIVESRSRAYVEGRVRAGVLEFQTAQLLDHVGVGARMRREGLVHRGFELRFDDRAERIDFDELTGGKAVTVYGQQEVVKDLITARVAAKLETHFGSEVLSLDLAEHDSATLRYREDTGNERTIQAEFIAGCDGFHGRCRAAIPKGSLSVYDHIFPFAWLGILAETPPAAEELIYANHDNGFALVSMRSKTVSRLYLQCRTDDKVTAWSDERVWSELRLRLESDHSGPDIVAGPVLQKGITPMRSFVCEPMRYGRLFLAGDSAHIVPPTGAKGMNLAIADVRVLARAMSSYFRNGSSVMLDAYSQTCLRRIWKTQRFSSYMTGILHRFDEHGPFERRIQLAELDYITSSRAAAASIAESYVGLPFEDAVAK